MLLTLCIAVHASEQRDVDTVGEVVRAAGDEEIRFVGGFSWRRVEPTQRLAAGDSLRTGRYGNLALLFRDQTQLRVHRDSFLVIEDVRDARGGARTSISMRVGALWARASRVLGLLSTTVSDDEPVQIKTPAVAVGIRGTDWFMRVEPDGRSTLITLSGEAVMSNALGSVSVSRGEIAIGEKGRAPVKRVIADLEDRPLLALEYRFAWRSLLRLTPFDASEGAFVQGLARAAERYDAGDFDTARRLIGGLPEQGLTDDDAARRDLLRGLLAARAGDDEGASRALAAAGAGDAATATVAALAEAGLALESGNYARAEALITRLESRAPGDVQVTLFALALMFLREQYDEAIERARAAERRHASDPRLPAMRAGFHLLIGDAAGMDEASQRAVTLGPRYAPAWHVRGVYAHWVALDSDAALAAYRQSVALAPDTPESWNNLALLYLELGNLEGSLDAARRAVSVGESSVLARANLAGVLMLLDRLDEAATVTDGAAALEPTHPQVLADRGYLAIYEGRDDDAVSEFSRAVTADPTLPGAQTNLAIAYYQAGRHDEGQAAIANAVRMDPDDPVAPLIGSTMALDQAEVGDAIRFARQGLDNALRFGSFAVENLANTQSGIMSVGAAYGAIGLGQWGDYYAQRAFDPYVAQSYSFLAARYPSVRANKGAAGQALLLDPTGVSAPSRYFEFLRQPRNDFTLSLSGGRSDGADSLAGTATVQGFLRTPAPVSYIVSASASDSEGARINSDGRSQSLLVAAGIRNNERRDNFVFALSASDSHQGVPGVVGDEDEDDSTEQSAVFASLGYHRRLGYSNRIFARVGLGRSTSRTDNPRPFGAGLSDLERSLIEAFGVDAARSLLAGGTFDSTAVLGFPDDPVLLTDPLFGPVFGFELMRSLPGRVDLNPIGLIETRTQQLDLQFRHLFDIGETHFTYGAEWMPRRQRTRSESLLFDPRGVGLLVPDLLGFPAGSSAFLFGGSTPLTLRSESSPTGGQIFAQASRELYDDLTIEGGLFLRYVDDGTRDLWQWDPRIGLAWQPLRGHWLRVAYQRELGHPGALNGTLAPVATVGLVVPDELVLLDGATVRDYRARWDAEWMPGLFTFVDLAHQNYDLVVTSVPETQDALVSGESELTSARFGVNVWFLERFGLSVSQRVNHSRIIDAVNRGNTLGLIPRQTFDAGLSWVHPSQLRVSALLRRVGRRAGNNANTVSLSPYWISSVSASWQFLDKRGAASIALSNLFDRSYELAPGVPAPGRGVVFSLEARF